MDIRPSKKLTKEQEREYHSKMVKGDIPSRDALVLSVIPFVLSVVSKFETRIDHSDLFQEACLELVSKAPKFNPDKGSFITFAKTVVRNRLLKTVVENKSVIRVPETNNPKSEISKRIVKEGVMTLPDKFDVKDPQVKRKEDMEHLLWAMSRIPGHLQSVLRLRYLQCLTRKEVAETLGYTVGYVASQEVAIIRRLRQFFK